MHIISETAEARELNEHQVLYRLSVFCLGFFLLQNNLLEDFKECIVFYEGF